jgi:tetratricopeptide (TPR) repeat protein
MRPCCFSLFFALSILLVPFSAPAQSAASDADSLQNALTTVDSLRQAGDFRAALSRLQSLRTEQPEQIEVLWRLVYTWVDLGKNTDGDNQRAQYYGNAINVAEAGLEADSSSARAHLAMAVAEGRAALDAGTRERIERSRAVKRHADRAIAIDSTLDGAYHTRGRWHREVEDIGFFQRAIVKTVYGGLPESSIEQSVQDFQTAIELHDEVFHHLELAKTYLQMDRPEDARRELQTALDMSDPDPFAPQYKEEAQELLDDLD